MTNPISFNMTNVSLFSAALLYGMMMLFVSGAPLSTTCETPSDLSNIYERLAAATIRNTFWVPDEYILPSTNQTLHQGETACPNTLPTSGKMQDRSSCPWYYRIIKDSTLFPPVRSEAVCRCHDCIGTDRMVNCEMVYSEMFFLKRTSRCENGLFVYEPKTKAISTGCVCAHKKTTNNPSNISYDT